MRSAVLLALAGIVLAVLAFRIYPASAESAKLIPAQGVYRPKPTLVGR